MLNTPLRTALLLDSTVQPRWVYRIIAEIQRSDFARVALVVLNGCSPAGGAAGPQPAFPARVWRFRRDLLYLLYRKLDRRLFRVERDAFELVDAAPLLQGCPRLTVTPRQTGFSDYLEGEETEKIRAYDLDVALRFGFRILRGEFLNLARYGVWSYHHGDNRVNRGGPPGFWEVMEASPVTGSVLQVLGSRLDAGRVIYRSFAGTEPHSVHRNKNNYYWKSSDFVLRKLADLHARGPVALEPEPEQAHFQPYSHRLYTQPGNLQMTALLGRWAWCYAGARLANALYRYQWFIAFHLGRQEGPAGTLYRFRPILPPADRFWADPFPLKRGERFYIFLEEYLYREGKGRIAVLELDRQGNWTPPRVVLERDYHLSYPFIFEWQGELYLLPETADNRTVELYRCLTFPDRWALEKVLLEGVTAADATLAEVDGVWWMFVTIAVEGASKNDELHLFYADSPLGPWRPHRANPVKSDVRSARPAGRLFRWNGALYRPAQDCSATYGAAVSLNRILRLDRDCYEEQEVSKLLPRWRPGLISTHTFNVDGELTVVDALHKRRRLFS